MIAFDFETTGLIAPYEIGVGKQPHAIELCAIKIDEEFEPVDKFHSYFKPPIPIPDFITKITGIDDETVADSPTFIELYDDIAQFFLGETGIVAHNCAFDRDILRFELERCDLLLNFPWPKNHFCTVELSYAIQGRRLTLTKLHEIAVGRPHDDGRHEAEADVLALIRCFQWLCNNGFVKS